MRPGNAPSGCAFREITRQPRDRKRYGVTTQPAPFPGSMTTVKALLRIDATSTFERIASRYRWFAVSSDRIEPTSDHAATRKRPSEKIDSIASSSSRLASMPRASSALSPLNSRGLWDAVTTTPPFRWPDFARKYWADGVGTTPRSTTSQPADMRPDAAARASIGPLSRVSRPRRPSTYDAAPTYTGGRSEPAVTSASGAIFPRPASRRTRCAFR